MQIFDRLSQTAVVSEESYIRAWPCFGTEKSNSPGWKKGEAVFSFIFKGCRFRNTGFFVLFSRHGCLRTESIHSSSRSAFLKCICAKHGSSMLRISPFGTANVSTFEVTNLSLQIPRSAYAVS